MQDDGCVVRREVGAQEVSGWLQLWLRVLCVFREVAKARASLGGVTGRAAAVNAVPAPVLGR